MRTFQTALLASLLAVGIAHGQQKQTSTFPSEPTTLEAINSPTPPAPDTQPEKSAEEVYKNIQVFKGLPESQLLNSMFFMLASLNTSCGHCHVVGEFERDDKPAKLTARKMILMVRQLNESQFQGKRMISCNTCHRGQTPPESPLTFAAIVQGAKAVPKKHGDLPSADQLFARHVKAMGGEAALKKINSRVMTGTRSSSEGWEAPVEINEKAPDKWMSRFELDSSSWIQAFNGTGGWNQDNQGVHDLKDKDLPGLKQDSEFYRDLKLKEMFLNARTVGRDRIVGQDVYVVEAQSAGGAPKKLYFDVATGFLVRIAGSDPSAFGPLPHAVDYAEYRQVDNIVLPFKISHLKPDFSMTDTFTSIRQNLPIDEKKFERPAK